MNLINSSIAIARRGWRRLRANRGFSYFSTRMLKGLRRVGLKSDAIVEHLRFLGEAKLRLANGRILKLRSYGDDDLTNSVFWTDTYEPETTNLFFKLACRSNTTLDIGAHVGVYALMAALANPNGRVFAFEPLPVLSDRLVENIRLNGVENLQAFSSALSDHVGSTAFYYEPGMTLPSNSTLREASNTSGKAAIQVTITTIAQFVKDHAIAKIDLIKMDTEGTELDVLKGMGAVLERDRPAIIAEVLEGLGDITGLDALLRPLGYRYYRLEAAGPALQPTIQPHPVWWNYLFAPKPLSELL